MIPALATIVAVLCSPRGGSDEAFVLPVRSTQMYIDAACYTFSLDPVANELIAAHKRGVKLRVVPSLRKSPIPISRKDAEARDTRPAGSAPHSRPWRP